MSRDDIEDLVHRYSDAVVHRDAHRWASTWAPDGVWDLGGGRRVEGREAIVERWHESMARYPVVVQTVLNGTVDLDTSAGTGSGRWYVQEMARRIDGEAVVMTAHYDDTYGRVDGGWRFASRRLSIHYRGAPDLSADFPAEGHA